MKTFFLRWLSAAAFMLLASWLLASEPTPLARSASDGPKSPSLALRASGVGDDIQEFAFLAEARPVLVRLHVRVDGKPLSAAWDDFMKFLFAYLDVNGDGVLNKQEAERAPPINQLVSIFNGFGGGNSSPSMKLFDGDKDGKVSVVELSAYYRKNGFQPLQFQFDLSSNEARDPRAMYFGGSRPDPEITVVSKAIFALLDSDKDGKLTQKELDAAPSVLLARDENEDEIITTRELVPEEKPKGYPLGYSMASNSGNNGSAGNHLLVPIPTPGQAPAELARRMYERYDLSAKKEAMKTLAKARPAPAMAKPAAKADSMPKMSPSSKAKANGPRQPAGKKEPEPKLTRKQLGLEEATFARLDADKDGVLNAKELAAFARRAPDLCLTLSFGERAGDPLDLAAVMGRPALLADKIRIQDDMGLVDLGATRMELRCREEKKRANRFLDLIRPQLSVQFKQADKKNKGYLDEKEAKGRPPIGNLFKQIDRDGDGKLYEKEMLAYLDGLVELQQRATAGCATLVLRDLSRGLFDLLDSNRDGKLSVREINGAPKLLAMLNRQGQGCLRREDIPHSYQLALRRGPAKPPGFDQEARITELYFGKDEEEIASGRGPAWFCKMDRNRDGDVSRKEFLFSDELFRKIDRDGDGLISLEEANKAGDLSRK